MSAEFFQIIRATIKNLGLMNAIGFMFDQRIRNLCMCLGLRPPDSIYAVRVKGIEHPILCRALASDRMVFRQIFIENEYASLDTAKEVSLIIDCGANVGYSSAYLLSKHPGARVIAVEPDEGNFVMLQKNLEPYGDRAVLIQGGVWSHKCGLVVCRGTYRDGREWSTQVRECGANEIPDVSAVDIGTLLEQSGAGRIDILKIDIEGSEQVLFSGDCEGWLNKVKHLAIELHDDYCRQAFLSSIAIHNPNISYSGELTICQMQGQSFVPETGT